MKFTIINTEYVLLTVARRVAERKMAIIDLVDIKRAISSSRSIFAAKSFKLLLVIGFTVWLVGSYVTDCRTPRRLFAVPASGNERFIQKVDSACSKWLTSFVDVVSYTTGFNFKKSCLLLPCVYNWSCFLVTMMYYVTVITNCAVIKIFFFRPTQRHDQKLSLLFLNSWVQVIIQCNIFFKSLINTELRC